MSPVTALSSRLGAPRRVGAALGAVVAPLVAPAVERVRAWPVESQLGARRNAMVAGTALAARRAEREDVEAFLASRGADAPDAVASTDEAPSAARL